MEPLIVTACTEAYRSGALALAANAVEHGLSVLIRPYADRGSWIENCRQKPILLYEVLQAQLGDLACRPLLWIDADGSILRRPPVDLLNSLAGNTDFAACPSRAGLGRRFCTGTLWVNATAAAARFMAGWTDLCTNGQGTDEAQLQIAVETLGSKLRLGELPLTFGWLPKAGPPMPETVVQHRLSGRARRAREKSKEWGPLTDIEPKPT